MKHTDADNTRCAACVEARERLDTASADRARAWLRYRDASEAYFNDTTSGALSLGSSECTQRWSDVDRLWHEAQARYTEWIAVQHEAAQTISEHSQCLQGAAGEVREPVVPLAETEEMHTVERHETEEDDVLRDAVRAIEHGETTQIRAWGFGNRQGRRTALRELRELLDDMIASIDADREEGTQ